MYYVTLSCIFDPWTQSFLLYDAFITEKSPVITILENDVYPKGNMINTDLKMSGMSS